MPKNKKLALKLGIQTYQILTFDVEACIPSLSSILLAVAIIGLYFFCVVKLLLEHNNRIDVVDVG